MTEVAYLKRQHRTASVVSDSWQHIEVAVAQYYLI